MGVARGSKDGRGILTHRRETTGAPAKIVLHSDRKTINADGEDVSVIAVEVVDAQGRVVSVALNQILFRLSGAGRLIGVGNGDPSCHEADKSSERSAFNGLCMAIVQSKRGDPGPVTVTVTSAGLETATVVVNAAHASLIPIVE